MNHIKAFVEQRRLKMENPEFESYSQQKKIMLNLHQILLLPPLFECLGQKLGDKECK